MKVRTRFAPSPTGYLHIGGVRTALYCYALAKRNRGEFIVRVEDTDEKRRVEGATEEIFDMLEEYGLVPDESLRHGGDHGPYLQSLRKDIYMDYAMQLIHKGNAYYCFLEGEELEEIKKEYKGRGIRSPYRDMSNGEARKKIEKGASYVIRLKVPNNETIEYTDGLHGLSKFDSNVVGDEILIKSSGMASYHLAVVVDDHLMRISHVLRAIEWFPSSPKQVLIHRFLGLEMPPYYHLPVIIDPSTGKKMSKRTGTVSARAFLEEGYLADAILNFLMLLGWSSPEARVHGEREREIFSLQEFIDLFDLKDLNKSNAAFNREKLLWFNKEYIKNKSADELVKIFMLWLDKHSADKSLNEAISMDTTIGEKLNLVKDRAQTLIDVLKMVRFFYVRPENIDFSIKQLDGVRSQMSDIRDQVTKLHEGFSSDTSTWTHEAWETGMRAIGDQFGVKHGDVFMVLRMYIVGEPFSPPLFECLQVLGKEEVLKRLKG